MTDIHAAQNTRAATYACYASFIALGLAATMLGPAYKALTGKFGMRLEDAGIFTGLQFFGVCGSVLFYGWLLQRTNARYVLQLGAALMGAGALLLAVAATLPIALFAILLLGLGFGALDIGPNITIIAMNPERAGIASNFLNAIFGFGAIAGPQLVNFGLSRGDVGLSFLILGVLTLALIVPLQRVNVFVGSAPHTQTRAQVDWRRVAPYILVAFLYTGVEGGFGAWLFTQMTLVAGSTEAAATLGTSLIAVGLTVGRFAASLLLRVLSGVQMIATGSLVITGGAVLLLLLPKSQTAAQVAALIVGLGFGPIWPTAFATVTSLYPAARGRVSGVVTALGTSGAAIFPWVQGQIGAGRDGGMILTPILALGILAVAGYIAYTMRHRT